MAYSDEKERERWELRMKEKTFRRGYEIYGGFFSLPPNQELQRPSGPDISLPSAEERTITEEHEFQARWKALMEPLVMQTVKKQSVTDQVRHELHLGERFDDYIERRKKEFEEAAKEPDPPSMFLCPICEDARCPWTIRG